MATTLTFKPSGTGRYGHNKSADGTNSTGSGSLYVGRCDGGSNYLAYGSSIPFKFSNLGNNGQSIVITSAILTTTQRRLSPYSSGIQVFVNTTSYPSPLKSGVSSGSTGPQFSASTNLSQYLTTLTEYANNGTTFYIHILNPSLMSTGTYNSSNAGGGVVYGTGESERPTLTITWDYAESTGSLSASSFNVGTNVTLSLNVKGSNYYHSVVCKINGTAVSQANINSSFTGTSSSLLSTTTKTVTLNFKPSASEINTWFGTTGKTASGVITIITYNSSGSQVGNAQTINFTLNLTQDYCSNLSGYFPSVSFTSSTSGYIISNYAKYTITATRGANTTPCSISSFSLTSTSNNYSGTTTDTTGKTAISTTLTLGTGAIVSTVTLKDARGFSKTSTNSINPTRTSYSLPSVSTFELFRTDGSKKATNGTYVGCNIKINFTTLNGNNKLSAKLQQGSGNSYSTTASGGSLTISNFNIFNSGNYATNSSYAFTLTLSDSILSSSAYNHPSGTSVAVNNTLPKAQFIISITDSGQGLGFMTSGEAGYISMGMPIKGLMTLINGSTPINLFADSKEGLCENIGALYNPSSESVKISSSGNLTASYLIGTSRIQTNLLTSYTTTQRPLITVTTTDNNNSDASLVIYGAHTIPIQLSSKTNIPVYINNIEKGYVVPSDEIYYKDGDSLKYIVDNYNTASVDTISLFATNFFGYMTSSRKSLIIEVPLQKRIKKNEINGVKVSSFKAIMRTIEPNSTSGGYYTLKNDWSDMYNTNKVLLDSGINYLNLLNPTSSGSNLCSRINFNNEGEANSLTITFAHDGTVGTGDHFYGYNTSVISCAIIDLQLTFTYSTDTNKTGVYT